MTTGRELAPDGVPTGGAPGSDGRRNVVIDDLTVAYRVRGRDRLALRNLDLAIAPGESFGLVGESGCGKSTLAHTLIRYLPPNGRVVGGAIEVAARDVLALKGAELRMLRSESIAMVYQSPGRALNPTMKVGRQLAESYVVRGADWRQAGKRAREMLRRVQIADPDMVMERYPRELSGGMQQRVVIGMALAKDPELLILDEPTTGLDATVEAEVLEMIGAIQQDMSTSLLFISHDLAVVSQMCDRIGILYAGRLVEGGSTREVFQQPKHPYTASLLNSVPQPGMAKERHQLAAIPGALPRVGNVPVGCVFQDRCGLVHDRCRTEEPQLLTVGEHAYRCFAPERVPELVSEMTSQAQPRETDAAERPVVLAASGVTKTFGIADAKVKVLNGIDLELRAGETLGVVGESGSGKSTLARILVGLLKPDDGTDIRFRGERLGPGLEGRTAQQLTALQMVFQNPDTALNERHSNRRIISRAARRLRLSSAQRTELISSLADQVRLPEEMLSTRPSSLSGGMKQRVAVARAFASSPEIVFLDEPTSALDVSVQAAILNLLVRLQQDSDSSYLFISHDLGVVRYISDRIIVMYLGRVMESGTTGEVFVPPFHPYTEALLSTSAHAASEPGTRERVKLTGEPPSVAQPPSGCVFNTRCPRKIGAICETTEPPVQQLPSGHTIRCHIPAEELAIAQAGG